MEKPANKRVVIYSQYQVNLGVERNLLLLIMLNNSKTTSFSKQNYYKNRMAYNRALKDLEAKDFIEIHRNRGKENEATLTIRGVVQAQGFKRLLS